jgi:hypothetical protein
LSPKNSSNQGKIVTTGLPAQHNKIRNLNMTLTKLAISILAMLAANLVQAASASTSFTLDSTPIFSFNTPATNPAASAGQWLTDNSFTAYTRSITPGNPLNEVSISSYDLPSSASTGAPFGTAQGGIPTTAQGVSTNVKYQAGSISTGINIANPSARASASVDSVWSRSYQLSPNASLTFSGIATLSDIGTPQPIDFNFSSIGHTDPESYRLGSAYLSADSANNSIYLSAIFTDCNFQVGCPTPNGSLLNTTGVFSYKTSSDGVFSLTISNPLNTTAYGNLRMNLNTDVVAAIPEPQTYLLMLAGLGLVGAASRKRSKAA